MSSFDPVGVRFVSLLCPSLESRKRKLNFKQVLPMDLLVFLFDFLEADFFFVTFSCLSVACLRHIQNIQLGSGSLNAYFKWCTIYFFKNVGDDNLLLKRSRAHDWVYGLFDTLLYHEQEIRVRFGQDCLQDKTLSSAVLSITYLSLTIPISPAHANYSDKAHCVFSRFPLGGFAPISIPKGKKPLEKNEPLHLEISVLRYSFSEALVNDTSDYDTLNERATASMSAFQALNQNYEGQLKELVDFCEFAILHSSRWRTLPIELIIYSGTSPYQKMKKDLENYSPTCSRLYFKKGYMKEVSLETQARQSNTGDIALSICF